MTKKIKIVAQYCLSFIRAHAVDMGVGLLLTLIVFYIYYQALFVGFFSDDYHMLAVASENKNLLSFFFTNIEGGRGGSSYGPILNIFFSLEYALFHLHAFWYHAVSLIIYLTTAFFVCAFVRRISNNQLLAWGAAFVFAVMHNHAESLMWIAVLPHLLATLFCVICLYCYTRFIQEKKIHWYVFALLVGALSLWTKEISIMLPCALLAVELWFARSHMRAGKTYIQIFKRLTLFGGMVLVYLCMRSYATHYILGSYAQQNLAFNAYDMFRMFVEMNVNFFAAFPQRVLITDWLFSHWYILVLCFVGIGFVVYFCAKKEKSIIVTLILYCISILPFLQMQYSPVNNEGERYTYFVSIFAAGIIAGILYAISSACKSKKAVFIILCLLYALYSIFLVRPKLTDWMRADVLARSMIQSYQTMDAREGDYDIFVGIPDTVAGAQVFRNAIAEALRLETDKKVSSTRIPIYTAFTRDFTEKGIVKLEKIEDNIYELKHVNDDAVLLFTGFKEFQDNLGKFELFGFQKKGFLGSSIRITLDSKQTGLFKERGKRLFITYVSEGMFVREQIN